VTIPKKIRENAGLKPGSDLDFTSEPGGRIVATLKGKRTKSDFEKRLDKVRGSMKGKFTTEEIMRLTRG
jgi:AbrB family looped-hinge helix DNA binding protein